MFCYKDQNLLFKNFLTYVDATHFKHEWYCRAVARLLNFGGLERFASFKTTSRLSGGSGPFTEILSWDPICLSKGHDSITNAGEHTMKFYFKAVLLPVFANSRSCFWGLQNVYLRDPLALVAQTKYIRNWIPEQYRNIDRTKFAWLKCNYWSYRGVKLWSYGKEFFK